MWKPRSPKAVAYHRNLYTRMALGGETDDMETWFDTEFETPAGMPLKRAVGDARLSAGDWAAIVRFLAAHDARTPVRMFERLRNWNETMPSLLEECLEDTVAALQDSKRTGSKLPDIQALDEWGMFPVRTRIESGESSAEAIIHTEATIGRSMWLWSLKRLLTTTLNILHTHRWTILRSPPGHYWLTSDNPVLRLNYSSRTSYDLKGGWGSEGTEIMMPLSPTHLLYTRIGAQRVPARGTVMSIDFTTQIRRFTVENAHRYVFSHAVDPVVSEWRPRTVDSHQFSEERAFWDSWNVVQVEAEKAHMSAIERTRNGSARRNDVTD